MCKNDKIYISFQIQHINKIHNDVALAVTGKGELIKSYGRKLQLALYGIGNASV